ncbi:hypothetical protein [Tessaracoccus sp. G1721]
MTDSLLADRAIPAGEPSRSSLRPDADAGLPDTWQLDVPGFEAPYVDVDEARALPVPHRYVHGGFAGTDTRFSFYFPPAEGYQVRFFQHVTPVPQSENLAPLATGEEDKITFALTSGGYLVETNGGGPDAANPFSGMDPTIGAYRANAAAAQFSREVARAIYGDHRPYGYLYGGSGGGFRTIGAAENTSGVWDGFVPYVIGSPMAMPNVFCVRMHAQRVLRDVLPGIADAYDVGGDPSSLTLNAEQRAAFEEVTRMGFPVRSWFGWRTMGMHGFSALYPGVLAADPSYPDDFWTQPGYLGADPESGVHADRVVHEAMIVGLGSGEAGLDAAGAGGVDESFRNAGGVVAAPVELRLDPPPSGWMLGAELRVTGGAAAGQTLRVESVDGDVVHLEPGQAATAALLAAGNPVVLDNSNFLAAQTYHRHQVPGSEYEVWDQFRDESGSAIYPQRQMLLGPLFTASASGTVPTGAVTGKMIVVACLLDREAFPWQADWYRRRVDEHAGGDASHRFRLWFMDNATHGDSEGQEERTHTVSYVGALHAALRQLAAWVEDGVEPARTTSYTVSDGQVAIPAAASERAGVQPVVEVLVNGAQVARVRAGEVVDVVVAAELPSGGLPLSELALDLAGVGDFGQTRELDGGTSSVEAFSTSFDRPGTYFVAARVTSQDPADRGTSVGRVHNIARARVIVD